ncbi:MAG: cation:proton antiporter [Chitinispirillaceae bacterium]|nr:cation:proton antiporter [Chitinispirillaceae bacterium]
MHHLNETHIFLFLVQLFIIILSARFAGEVFKRFKQPALTAELLIGVVLGPTVLGRFLPSLFDALFPADQLQQGMLETAAWIGVLFLLLDTGLEIDFSAAWRQRGNALIIALSDIVIPMVIAFIPILFLPDSYLADPHKRLLFGLFMAVVMTISAMPVASRVMHDLNILKTDLGFLTMSALAVNDIIGWVLFTIIMGLFMQQSFQIGSIAMVFTVTIGFSALALTAGKRFSNTIVDKFVKFGLPEPGSSFTFACLLGLCFGAFTQKLGIHALFGFFIAGIVVGEAKNLREETRTIISQMVHSLFVPVFFVNIGLKIDFTTHFDIFLVVLITGIGITGRFLGAWFGVSMAKVPKINKNLISIAHTPGGMMEIVVALLALENELIVESVFIGIVCSAVASSILMGPWMQLALKRRKSIKLSDYMDFSNGLVLIEDKDKTAVLAALIGKLSRIAKHIDSESILASIISREADYSTAIGSGIAIPHVRITSITDPVLLVGISKQGVEWNAPDGEPVHFIFFLLSPVVHNDLHVDILSRIAGVMQVSNNREQILHVESLSELTKTIRTICR